MGSTKGLSWTNQVAQLLRSREQLFPLAAGLTQRLSGAKNTALVRMRDRCEERNELRVNDKEVQIPLRWERWKVVVQAVWIDL